MFLIICLEGVHGMALVSLKVRRAGARKGGLDGMGAQPTMAITV